MVNIFFEYTSSESFSVKLCFVSHPNPEIWVFFVKYFFPQICHTLAVTLCLLNIKLIPSCWMTQRKSEMWCKALTYSFILGLTPSVPLVCCLAPFHINSQVKTDKPEVQRFWYYCFYSSNIKKADLYRVPQKYGVRRDILIL